MNRRLYFALLALGVAVTLIGIGLQVFNSYQRQEVRREDKLDTGVKVCKLAKDWQSVMRDKHPDADRTLPEIVEITPNCPLEK